MAISSHSDLVAAVRDWLGRANDTTNLTTARVEEMIAFAEADIYARLRVRDMETSTALTISAQSVALPTNLLEVRRLYLDGSPLINVQYLAPSQFWVEHRANVASRPRTYTIEGGAILFGPMPDATYTGRLLYYARPAALSGATNAIFTAWPQLFLYGALTHAAPFIGAEDEGRLQAMREMYELTLLRAQQQSDRAPSGAPLTIRVG